MSDRTSGGIFGMVFEHLAEDPTDANKAFAKKMWEKSRSYDFIPYQMGCDDALITLGLAKLTTDADGDYMISYEGDD